MKYNSKPNMLHGPYFHRTHQRHDNHRSETPTACVNQVELNRYVQIIVDKMAPNYSESASSSSSSNLPCRAASSTGFWMFMTPVALSLKYVSILLSVHCQVAYLSKRTNSLSASLSFSSSVISSISTTSSISSSCPVTGLTLFARSLSLLS